MIAEMIIFTSSCCFAYEFAKANSVDFEECSFVSKIPGILFYGGLVSIVPFTLFYSVKGIIYLF